MPLNQNYPKQFTHTYCISQTHGGFCTLSFQVFQMRYWTHLPCCRSLLPGWGLGVPSPRVAAGRWTPHLWAFPRQNGWESGDGSPGSCSVPPGQGMCLRLWGAGCEQTDGRVEPASSALKGSFGASLSKCAWPVYQLAHGPLRDAGEGCICWSQDLPDAQALAGNSSTQTI